MPRNVEYLFQVIICDEATVGRGALSPDQKQAYFGFRNMPKRSIQNIAFDSLGDFIRHPTIAERLNSSELRLMERKQVYFRNHEALFSPGGFGFFSSDAARIAKASTIEEVDALLLASCKLGGTNASTITANQFGLRG